MLHPYINITACFSLLGLTLFNSTVVAAKEYSLSASWVKNKSHFFEDFKDQRALLFQFGYPNTQTQLEQTLDTRSDSYAITAGYRYSRYLTFKASYLGKSDYSLKSTFKHISDTDNGKHVVEGQDSIKSKIIATRLGLTAELPILHKLAVGVNLGLTLSRINTQRNISGNIISANNTATPIQAHKTTSDYESNIYSGLYIAYSISEQWKIISHWDRYFNQGVYNNYPSIVAPDGSIISLNMGDNHHIDSYGIGIEYRFKGKQ